MKFGFSSRRWQRSISVRQTAMARWSSPASSLTPQRRSIAWNRAFLAAQYSASRRKTYSWRALRSSVRSSNVELTKTRNVLVDPVDCAVIRATPMFRGDGECSQVTPSVWPARVSREPSGSQNRSPSPA